jgi:hypothetical protein
LSGRRHGLRGSPIILGGFEELSENVLIKFLVLVVIIKLHKPSRIRRRTFSEVVCKASFEYNVVTGNLRKRNGNRAWISLDSCHAISKKEAGLQLTSTMSPTLYVEFLEGAALRERRRALAILDNALIDLFGRDCSLRCSLL